MPGIKGLKAGMTQIDPIDVASSRDGDGGWPIAA
jgi:hypothetical protein